MARNICYIFLYMILLLIQPHILTGDIEEIDDDDSFVDVIEEEYTFESSPNAVPKISNLDNLFIVSTIDGRISAVHPITGHTVWSIDTTGDLFVSSLSKVEVHSEGSDIRVVPSLDGRLFKFDGQKLELLPITVEKLLLNSHKLGDNLFAVGRKEITTSGINSQTGELKYVCNIEGCTRYTDVIESENILVIRRVTQTIRAVNARKGIEEWYFSIGDISVSLLKGSDHKLDFEVSGSALIQNELVLPPGAKLKIAMGEGSFGVIDTNTNSIIWSQTLPNPITNVWQLRDDDVVTFDLFDLNIELEEYPSRKPMLLIGRYDANLYVKMSTKISNWSAYLKINNQSLSYLPLHTGNSQPDLSPLDVDSIYDKGIMFYESISGIIEDKTQCLAEPFHLVDPCYFNYKKDVFLFVAMCVTMMLEVIIVVVVTSRMRAKAVTKILEANKIVDIRLNLTYDESDKSQKSGCGVKCVQKNEPVQKNELVQKNEPIHCIDFSSRFLTDFQITKVLGKGGFGVVFETRNKIDDCNYAIKRISLIKTSKMYEKVMREVKALAKLDHPGIVRYFNSWIEEPPLEWQEYQDKELQKTVEGCSDWNDSSSEDVELKSKYRKKKPKKKKKKDINPLKPFDDGLDFSSLESFQDSSSKCEKVVSSNNEPKMYLYIQMQLCRKESLRDWLWTNKYRDHKEMLFYFYQMTSAVQYVHSCGMIHRDLKPSNVFFAMDGSVKIGDFGLVCIGSQNEISYGNHIVGHTTDVGTGLYMSPEQMNKWPYDHKVDIYSLGIIFVELLCPFTTDFERIKVLDSVRNLVFSENFKNKYPIECSFVSLLLSPDPRKRPTAEQIIENNLFSSFY